MAIFFDKYINNFRMITVPKINFHGFNKATNIILRRRKRQFKV